MVRTLKQALFLLAAIGSAPALAQPGPGPFQPYGTPGARQATVQDVITALNKAVPSLNGSMTNPTITGGSASNLKLTTPSITGGTAGGVALSNPTIATPTITGGTATGLGQSNPAITGGTLSGSSVINPSITGGSFSGGDVSGENVTPRSGLLNTILSRRSQDALTFRDYGAVCDGAAHPLSSVTAWGTLVTAGWTLAQWQALYPAATSLSDELDARAIQAAASDPYALSVRGLDGVCRIDRTITWTVPKTVFGSGRGPGGTTFKAMTTSGDMFAVTSTDVQLLNVRFTAAAQRTGGAYVHDLQGVFVLDGFYAELGWDVANIDIGNASVKSTARVQHGSIFGSLGTNLSVLGGFDVLIDDVSASNDPGNPPTAGLFVQSVGDLRVIHSQFLEANNNLLVVPANGQYVASLWLDDSFFDTAVGRGAHLQIPVGSNGSIVRFRASNCWFSSAGQQGVLIENLGSGTISGVDFENPHMVVNGDTGLTTTGAVQDLNITDFKGGQNAHTDIAIGPGASGLSIRGGSLCTGMGLSVPTPTGLYIAATVNAYLVQGVRAIGCPTAALVNNSAGASIMNISGNLGF